MHMFDIFSIQDFKNWTRHSVNLFLLSKFLMARLPWFFLPAMLSYALKNNLRRPYFTFFLSNRTHTKISRKSRKRSRKPSPKFCIIVRSSHSFSYHMVCLSSRLQCFAFNDFNWWIGSVQCIISSIFVNKLCGYIITFIF